MRLHRDQHGEFVELIQVDIRAVVPALEKAYGMGVMCPVDPDKRAQDDPDVIAAVGVVLLFLWDRAWSEAEGSVTMELECLNSKQMLTADVNPLPHDVVVNVARSLLAEA